MGYKRNDSSTWKSKNIPKHHVAGLFDRFSFSHSQFVWDCKSEPGVRDIFAKIWGTDRLTVSFGTEAQNWIMEVTNDREQTEAL